MVFGWRPAAASMALMTLILRLCFRQSCENGPVVPHSETPVPFTLFQVIQPGPWQPEFQHPISRSLSIMGTLEYRIGIPAGFHPWMDHQVNRPIEMLLMFCDPVT